MAKIYIFSKDKGTIFNAFKKQSNNDAKIHVTSDDRHAYTPIIIGLTEQNKALLAVTTTESPQKAFRLAILKGFLNLEQAENLAKDVDRISAFETIKRIQKKERALSA